MIDLGPYHALLGWGEFSEIYLEDSHSLSLRWEGGRVESAAQAHESGAGLRFLNGRETRFGSVDLPSNFLSVSGDAAAKLKPIEQRLGEGFSQQKIAPFSLKDFHRHPLVSHPSKITLQEKIALLEEAYRAAHISSLIRQINVNYGEKVKNIACLNSTGQANAEERVYVVFSITVTVECGGDLQTGYESLGGLTGFELFDKERVKKLSRMVADRALAKLEAPQAPVGEMPIVIAASAGGTLIHEAVGHSLEADAVLEGTSPSYLGKLGQVVANEKLTVYDNPTLPGTRGSFRWDDEGVPAEASRLIENGVLKDYMFDRLSAARAGRASNGHGRRESYAHRPIPRMSNTYIASGPDDPKNIIDSFKNGLLVTKMGGGQVNTANGDFVFEVEEGFRVQDGKKTMVRGATLLGNGPETLKLIDQVGSDHGWSIGTCGKEGQGVPVSDAIPTIHIQKLVVGGQ